MPARVRVFLDTSALFAGIWSVEGGARMILKLAEAGAIRLLVSSQVLNEMESALRRKASDLLGLLALLLDRSGVEIVPSPVTRARRRFWLRPGRSGWTISLPWTGSTSWITRI